MEKAHHGKCKKITPWKIEENVSLENNRMENAHLGKWQKNHTLQKAREIMTGKCQNGNAHPGKLQNRKCTPWNLLENVHSGK